MPQLRRSLPSRIGCGLTTALLIAARGVWPPRAIDVAGTAALRDLIFTLAMLLVFWSLAAAAGLRIMQLIAPPNIAPAESAVYAGAVGSGLLAYSVLALGLTGLLTTLAVSVLMVALSMLLGPDVVALARRAPSSAARLKAWWGDAPARARTITIIAFVTLLFSVQLALTPPWDYDGLMYHLEGPRQFLRRSGLVANPDNWYVNGPFTIEMLFTIGLAFGDDVFPKLMHFAFGLLLLSSTFAVGRRWLNPDDAWTAIAILFGIPLLPILMGLAYIDMGWSLYEFLGLAAVLAWRRTGSTRWLLVGGALMGLAVGSKYLALIGLVILAAFLVFASLRSQPRQLMPALVTFLVSSAVVGAPWYLKNQLWFGNPVFPFLFGGPQWDPMRLDSYAAFLQSFGTGRSLLDYLLLPIHIFTQNDRFGALFNSVDIPSILFPFSVLLLLRNRPTGISSLLGLAGVRFVVWSVGSQQTRFLLPIFPALAIATAYFIAQPVNRTGSGRVVRNAMSTLAVGLMVVPAFYVYSLIRTMSTAGQLIGTETASRFLERNLTGYELLVTARDRAADDRLLMLGDGRGYYCTPGCVPDPDHFRWAAELATLQSCEDLQSWMNQRQVTSIFINLEDMNFLLQHDPGNILIDANRFILNAVELGCLDRVLNNTDYQVYDISGQ